MSPIKPEGLLEKAQRLPHMMRRIMHLHHKQSEQGRSEMLHPGQGRLLALILEKQPVGQKELVEALDVRPSSLSELLKKLEGKGLITRAPDEQDKRNTIVSLTPEGKACAEQSSFRVVNFEAELFDMLSDDEMLQLNALLTKVMDAWQAALNEAGEGAEMPFPPHHGHCGDYEARFGFRGPGQHPGPGPGFRERFRNRDSEGFHF